MTRIALNKIVAIEKGVKSTAYARFTKAHQLLKKKDLLSGHERTYDPIVDAGGTLPADSKRIQLRAPDAIRDIQKELVRLFDVVATKDWGNTEARADVSVNGKVFIVQAPVTYLLFLEKQLKDIKAFVEKLPILDPADRWEWDENQNCFSTDPVETIREKKVPKVIQKAKATEHHAEQAEVYMDTVPVGTWSLIKYSGALPATRVKELLDRVETLQLEVKKAREEANSQEVADIKVGEGILSWIFAD